MLHYDHDYGLIIRLKYPEEFPPRNQPGNCETFASFNQSLHSKIERS